MTTNDGGPVVGGELNQLAQKWREEAGHAIEKARDKNWTDWVREGYAGEARTAIRCAGELEAAIQSLTSRQSAGAVEPVAWGVAADGIRDPFLYVEHSEHAARRASLHAFNPRIVPLYTHPVQSVEVTDAKVKIALEAHADEMERQDRDESLPLKDRLHECMRAALISVMGNKDG